MGSPCDIQLFAANAGAAGQVGDIVVKDIERLEGLYSRYRENSVLSQINRVAAQGGTIRVDDETAGILDYAAACYAQSGGLFDVTSGILRRAWRFDGAALPDEALIRSLLDRIGWEKLCWQRPELSFPVPGLELDFGGIVKEYAVDRAASLCLQQGHEHAVVNLGGDVRVVGPRADGSPWRVGIRHPRRHGDVAQSVSIHRGAVASSGDYERCIVVDGVRYGHILNPKTGWPVRHMAAVSVIGEFCVVAGSASTIAMLKESDGPAWLADLGLPHIWIDTEGRAGGSIATDAPPVAPG